MIAKATAATVLVVGGEGDDGVNVLLVGGEGGGGDELLVFSPRHKLHFLFLITLQSA